ncbi:MAG: cytochrome c peroxidase [Blastocatellia bacterium]
MSRTACSSRRAAWPKLTAIVLFVLLSFAVLVRSQTESYTSAEARLGERLFHDDRFSSPAGDLMNSCSSCHLFDEDPQGIRARSDFFSRSWVPFRIEDPRRDALRNAQTIFDAALMPRLHYDGEFTSLEDLVKGTISGRPMGWLEGEQEQALSRVRDVVLKDAATNNRQSYRSQFKSVYSVEVESLSRDELFNLVAKAMSAFMRPIKSERSTPYDRFIAVNKLEGAPAAAEDPKSFGKRTLARLAALEAKREIKLPSGFDAAALRGFKIFLATDGASSVGNCVLCHAPPLFTDFLFHNIGISQSEYDQVHGRGSFSALEIPSAAMAVRPSRQFRETPVAGKVGWADLGYWNFADLRKSPDRKANESDDEFLKRMIGTFKTPTLRNLDFSPPYMHTGGFPTIESALGELMRLSEMARAGAVREADEELAKIKISEADMPALAAFLETLNEDLSRAKSAYRR